MVRNRAPADVMIQTWMDASDVNSKADVPFAITPALTRLAGEKQQTLRILYYGEGLPVDRESVFWLNVQEIPQKAKDDNVLQIAVRQRVKFFYRPAGLPGKIENAPSQLRWRLVQRDGRTKLEVSNPSAYFVSLASVKVNSGGRDYAAAAEMVAPSATRYFDVKDLPAGTAGAGAKVYFESINDYGAVEPHASVTTG
ncbi:gram-negative pili assembly chaperone, C-terminal domain protein [Burkholderia cepacia]|nr:gram-negative pili assembly chaperone, C-terminal domain protein [Burkholderia cepacia]